MVGTPFTIHTIIPGCAFATVSGLSYAGLYNAIENKEFFWFPKFNFVFCFLTGFAGYYVTKMQIMKKFTIGRFAPTSGAIGIKEITGRRDVGLPPMSVFYTCQRTNSSMNSKEMTSRVPWLPNHGDLRYNEGLALFMAEAAGCVPGAKKTALFNTLFFAFRHFSNATIEVVGNAPGSTQMLIKQAPQATEKVPCRIAVLCHGMAGHHHIHSDFAMRHLHALPGSSGVVICPNFADGSSSFCRRDERDIHGLLMTETKEKLSYDKDPPESYVKLRVEQNEKRVKELDEVLKWIGSREEKGLAATLFPQSPDLQMQFLDKISSPVSSKIEVRLIGHSFGASSCLAAVDRKIDGDGAVRIQSVSVLDPWMVPLATTLIPKLEQEQKEKFEKAAQEEEKNKATENNKKKPSSPNDYPPLVVIDSQEWDRWKINKSWEERLMKAYPGTVVREMDKGTDHLTALDYADMLPQNKFFRRQYVKKEDDSSFRRKWATRCVISDDRYD